MIRVFNIPAITWTLTAVLLLSGSYHLLQAAKPHLLTDRVNDTLHAVMNFLMAAMLWNLAPSTMLAQIAVLAGAALWFIIQAVARPEFKMLCAGSRGRLKCAYHSMSMGGAAVMIAMMGHGTGGEAPANATSMQHAHHSMTVTTPSTAAATIDHSPGLAILLTAIFGVAAAVFVLLVVLAGMRARHRSGASQLSVHAGHGLEAVGAGAMAMMFASMSS